MQHSLLGLVLAVISTESQIERGVLLSVVVHGSAGGPGAGFFEIARRLGRRDLRPHTVWDEVRAVWMEYDF